MGAATDRVDTRSARRRTRAHQPAHGAGDPPHSHGAKILPDIRFRHGSHCAADDSVAQLRGGAVGGCLPQSRRASGWPHCDALFIECHYELWAYRPATRTARRLMGALEALNGMLLFGLTTAFLYG